MQFKSITHSDKLTTQTQLAILIVFAKVNWQHWASDCNFNAAKCLLRKVDYKKCKF